MKKFNEIREENEKTANKIQEDSKEYEFIQLKNPPDADCSIYSKRHLTVEGNV
jgi:hypothetical protein